MDTDWFRDALARAGKTQADLARELDLLPSAVSRMLRGERGMKATEAVLVAKALGVPSEEILLRTAVPSTPSPTPPRRGRPPLRETQQFSIAQREDPMIPICDTTGSVADEPIAFTPRPANLAGVRDAYAIYVTDDRLSPRYEAGWLLHVHPFKPVVHGRDVVIYRNDKRPLLAQFIEWQGDTLTVRLLNPAETLRFRLEDVRACHLVVGVDQEG